MCRKVLHQSFCSLCQPEARPEIDRQSGDDQSDEEALVDFDWARTGFEECPAESCKEYCEGEDLESEAGQEDVVWCRWILLVRVGDL